VALTIAGSDSGGGAGIQADLKTFEAFHVFGTSAVTCITAQNPTQVAGIAAMDPEMVAQQVRTVCDAFPIAALKTGMLYSAEIIRAVATVIRERHLAPLVADPVMVSTSGARLLREDAIRALLDELFPLARVLTPNLPEAEILCGHPIATLEALTEAAREIAATHRTACVLKGGHLSGEECVDILADGGNEVVVFSLPRVRAHETHGTGCAFSAAITALLATNRRLDDAVSLAKKFVSDALARAQPAGPHWPLNLNPDA
jgi:hydroxymethylpyrimidine/phosphomethylpyrimidine kinase